MPTNATVQIGVILHTPATLHTMVLAMVLK